MNINILDESKHYIIYNEYEIVIAKIRNSHKEIVIGDFYGNPQMALISEDEEFCVMCGCGVIIYFLREPFEEYEYDNKFTKQWIEWGRDHEKGEVWVDKVSCISDKTVKIITEDGDIFQINVYN